MENQDFEKVVTINAEDLKGLTEEQFAWLPEDTKAACDLKAWIMASVKRLAVEPSLIRSFVNYRYKKDGVVRNSKQIVICLNNAKELRSWNTTSHEIGLEWAVEVAKHGMEAVSMLAYQQDMSDGQLVVPDFDNPRIIYWVGGWYKTEGIAPASVSKVCSVGKRKESSTFVTAKSALVA
ncbi:MAG: hypothetical protein FWC79_02845 [Oscillospiraceae bacterium]|nr:hypothetical protein [Oscillospiraceae bacterium]